MARTDRGMLGVLGGMGPLASAEFLRTLYDDNGHEEEQGLPAVVVYSDPAIPDRTSHFLRGEEEAVLGPLAAALRRLREAGSTRIVICCFTAHHLVPRLPDDLRPLVWSLVEEALAGVARCGGRREDGAPLRYLMVCSTGARRLGLFHGHPLWPEVEDRVVWPDEEDQDRVHAHLYRLKHSTDARPLAELVREMMVRYGADAFVAGCSEVHMVARHLSACAPDVRCVDPMGRIARQLAEEHAR
ncbi:MAG TPA: aspartate/glutamate racemase family protein [Longimicrobiaceae bacterium]|nr:aspartate/glutamate racemase family protein [Longimicrobiaceae bacterium]